MSEADVDYIADRVDILRRPVNQRIS